MKNKDFIMDPRTTRLLRHGESTCFPSPRSSYIYCADRTGVPSIVSRNKCSTKYGCHQTTTKIIINFRFVLMTYLLKESDESQRQGEGTPPFYSGRCVLVSKEPLPQADGDVSNTCTYWIESPRELRRCRWSCSCWRWGGRCWFWQRCWAQH